MKNINSKNSKGLEKRKTWSKPLINIIKLSETYKHNPGGEESHESS